ncbi:MAG TPA: PIG-L family deacetylase [Phycisphaerae bacterium]|nr:PIG-L family deacetylase [Phycisphaerae bacterium]
MRIAVVGPHPDDQELAMGGAIASFVAAGHTVTLIDMTTGEPTPFGSEETRAKEAAAAAQVLGVQRVSAGLKNREVVHNIESRHRVAALYRRLRPDILFVPYPQDAHPDHLAVTRIAEDARFDGKLTKSAIPGDPWYCRRIIYYFCTHLRFNFPATFCLDITPVWEKKLAAIDCYQSQFYAGRTGAESGAVVQYITTISRYFGGTINTPYAEPFHTPEMLGLTNLNALTH